MAGKIEHSLKMQGSSFNDYSRRKILMLHFSEQLNLVVDYINFFVNLAKAIVH